jgi:UDP-N-acetylglucosamine 2-epimerase
VKVLTIVGTRPQLVKASPLSRELRRTHQEVLVHTGQHYDHELSGVFFEELGLPPPDYHLAIGSQPHGAQTGAMMIALEPVVADVRPDLALVYGDTNSTLAGALVAAKLHVPLAHVEAGLRSFNRRMPEEVNRIVTDRVSTWLFAPSDVARRQLEAEGLSRGVHVVGDIMADALRIHGERAAQRAGIVARLGLGFRGYYLATLHRAENSDAPETLRSVVRALDALDRPVVLPLHPRTMRRMESFGIRAGDNVNLLPPVGYLDMLRLLREAACVVTDSGGVQREAYYLGTPCVTLRAETEWVETVETGWNVLAGTDPDRIVQAAHRLRADGPAQRPVLYGDGRTSERIVRILGGGLPDGESASAPLDVPGSVQRVP